VNIFDITDPGSLADWFTGVVALAALIVAVFAGRAALQTNRAQQKTLALQQKQYEQSQAEKISFWCDAAENAKAGTHPWPVDISIVNASDSPVYDVLIVWVRDHPSLYLWRDGYTFVEVNIRVLERTRTILPTGGAPFQLRIPTYARGIYFTDAMGRHWFRESGGTLSSIESVERHRAAMVEDFKATDVPPAP
jgi:hypothetical protein